MKKLLHIFIKSTLALLLLSSCFKRIDGTPSYVYLRSYLTDGPWQLISASTYTTPGSINARYVGTVADSIWFGYGAGANANVVLTNIYSFIGGSKKMYSYNLIPLDSIVICSPSWKPGYSDTLHLTSFSDYSLVFQVRSTNSNSIEVDSLKKIRFH